MELDGVGKSQAECSGVPLCVLDGLLQNHLPAGLTVRGPGLCPEVLSVVSVAFFLENST
jgi:hypothetical protein